MSEQKQRGYKDLSLTQLRSFCEVCRRGGYAAAARELLLTSPAVWEQMQALERHYGLPLLERRGGSMAPTPHGEQLLEMIRPLLAGLDSSRDVLRQQDGALPRELTLVTNMRVLVDEIGRALRRFRTRFPGIQLRVLYVGLHEIGSRAEYGETDVTFTLEPGPGRPAPSALEYEPVGEIDYLLVTPPRHPLGRRRALHLSQIVEQPLVLGEPGAYSRRRVQEVLHRYDLTPHLQIAVETSSDEYTLFCVRSGLGVGITIGTGRGHLYSGLGVRTLRHWFGTARLGFLWSRGAHLPPAQRQLAAEIRRALNEVKRRS